MCVYVASSLIAAVSNSTAIFLTARVIEGTGAAMIMGTGIALITSVFPPRERGRAIGINVAAVYLGLSLGHFIARLLPDFLTWRRVFLFNVPLGLPGLPLASVDSKRARAAAPGAGTQPTRKGI